MKVYLVIIEDRHHDIEVHVYATAEAALDRAREAVEEYGYEPEDPGDASFDPASGWLFNACLSIEGDCVHVEEAEVK